MTRQLPTAPISMLFGKGNADALSESLIVAYWMHGRDNGTALFHWSKAHKEFADLAEALGYTIAPIEAPVAAEVAA